MLALCIWRRYNNLYWSFWSTHILATVIGIMFVILILRCMVEKIHSSKYYLLFAIQFLEQNLNILSKCQL